MVNEEGDLPFVIKDYKITKKPTIFPVSTDKAIQSQIESS